MWNFLGGVFVGPILYIITCIDKGKREEASEHLGGFLAAVIFGGMTIIGLIEFLTSN